MHGSTKQAHQAEDDGEGDQDDRPFRGSRMLGQHAGQFYPYGRAGRSAQPPFQHACSDGVHQKPSRPESDDRRLRCPPNRPQQRARRRRPSAERRIRYTDRSERVDINTECEKLEALARSRPNVVARATVLAGLRSKWEGVQVHAGRALAAWADPESVSALRDWLIASLGKEAGWSVTSQAVKCVAQAHSPDDLPWMLDLYFSQPDRLKRHDLLPLTDCAPPVVLREFVSREAASGERHRVEAARVALRRLEAREM